MENVLDLYAEASDPKRPVICFDESPTQLIGEVRQPIPAAPGQIERYDCEYQRNGTVNLFIFPCGWARFQFLPIRTAREVFPQAAHPMKFSGRVMCRLGHGGHFHAYVAAPGKGWIFQSQYSPSTP